MLERKFYQELRVCKIIYGAFAAYGRFKIMKYPPCQFTRRAGILFLEEMPGLFAGQIRWML